MEDKSSSILFLYRNRKFLFITFLVGSVLSAGITFIIPEKYLSTAIVYPVNSHTRNEIVGNPQFGYETETEQLLQLLESKTMRQRTIDEFDLVSYYEMDTSRVDWKSELDLKYIKDVKFLRSKYLSIVINVTTRIPELSAKIANFQMKEVNAYRNAIFEKNRQQEFKSVQEDLIASEKKCAALRDSIYRLKGGKQQLLFNFIENLNNEEYNAAEFVDSPEIELLIEQYMFEYGIFKDLKKMYKKLEVQINAPMPAIYTIDKAVPSFKKVSPSYSVNTVLGGFSFLLIVITGMVVRQELSKLKMTEEKRKGVD